MDIPKSKRARPVLAILSLVVGAAALGTVALAQGSGPVVHPRALANATTTLEKNTGGKVMEVRLADIAGPPAFEAAIKKDEGLIYMRIAAAGDEATEIEVAALPKWLRDYHLEAFMRSVDKAKIPLADAIVRAEELAAAPAIGAGIAKPLSAANPVLAYYVETIKGKQRIVAAVDAKSGNLIAQPASLFQPFTPVSLARRLAAQ